MDSCCIGQDKMMIEYLLNSRCMETMQLEGGAINRSVYIKRLFYKHQVQLDVFVTAICIYMCLCLL